MGKEGAVRGKIGRENGDGRGILGAHIDLSPVYFNIYKDIGIFGEEALLSSGESPLDARLGRWQGGYGEAEERARTGGKWAKGGKTDSGLEKVGGRLCGNSGNA